METSAVIFQQLDRVSQLIARYASIETIYVGTNVRVEDQLCNAVCGVYVSILMFLSKSIKYLRANPAKRIAYGAFTAVVSEAAKDIAEADQRASLALQVASSERLENLNKQVSEVKLHLEVFDDDVSRLSQIEMVQAKTVKGSEFSTVCSWLSTTRYADHHQSNYEALVDGTGSWLKKNQRYEDWWSASSSSIFHIHGPPGCGKTALTSTVIEHLKNEKISGRALMPYIGYFYCSKAISGVEQADLDITMRTIVKQFCCSSTDLMIEEHLLQTFTQKVHEHNIEKGLLPPLTLEEAQTALLRCLDNGPGAIVIDAVDELGMQQQRTLISILERLVQKSANLLKIFISSRDIRPTSNKDQGTFYFEVSKTHTASDMEHFVDLKVSEAINTKKLLNGQVSSNAKQKIFSLLNDNAGGM